MADQTQDLGALIAGMTPDDKVRTSVWNAYHTAQDSNALEQNLGPLALSPAQKTALWNHWHTTHPGPSGQGLTDDLFQEGAEKAVGAAKGAYHYLAERGPSGIASDLSDVTSSAWEGAKDLAKRGFQAAKEFVVDPHSTLPTAGAIIGGSGGGIPGAAMGAASGENIAQIWDAAVHGKVSPDPTLDVALAGAGGALGEVIPRIPNIRPLQSEGGQLVEKLYGRTAMPHQMTDSSALDFLYNIAGGMTGAPRIGATEAAQGDVEKAAVRNIAGRIHPSMGVSPDVQAQTIRQQAAQIFDQAQKPLQSAYARFMQIMGGQREQVPDPITGVMKAGKSLAEMHEERSAYLQQGRDALSDGDNKAAYEANKAADAVMARMRPLMGQQGSQIYDRLGNFYRQVMDRYDNPLMSKIRRGIHPEQLADMILNPEAGFPKMTPLGGKVSQTIPEMIGRVKEALPPDAWQNLQATVLQRLYENSVKLSAKDATVGELSAKSMKNQLARMGDGAFQALFGTNGQAIKDFTEAVSTAGRSPGATGKFFIDLRQAEAVRAVAAGTVGTVAGLATEGDYKRKSETGTLAAGVTYLVAPWALARLMTNPNTRGLFIRMLQTSDPTLAQQMAQGLTKLLAQGVSAAGASQFKTGPTEGPGIPEPPARALPQGAARGQR